MDHSSGAKEPISPPADLEPTDPIAAGVDAAGPAHVPVEVREPPSRPRSPKRPPRAARTIVSFDWEPFPTDTLIATDAHTASPGPVPLPEAAAPPAPEVPPAATPHLDGPTARDSAPHRTLGKLAALLRRRLER